MKLGNWPVWKKSVANVVKELTDQHPYYPRDLSLPGFKYQKLDFGLILGVFAALAILIALTTFLLSCEPCSLP